jgi:DNA-binding NarL/FixJ family response regulator
MFQIKKILISEDIDSISTGIENTLKNFIEAEFVHTRYCDDAMLKLKKADLDKEPFDLLITDLSFQTDYREVKLSNGEDLIKAVRAADLPTKIIVFTVEDKPMRVEKFFNNYNIDAYVQKGRNDTQELAKAIEAVQNGVTYITHDVQQKLKQNRNISSFDMYDVNLVKYLCEGKTQEEISIILASNNIKPNSVSTIEKRLKVLRENFSANTNIELAIIFKDLGLV